MIELLRHYDGTKFEKKNREFSIFFEFSRHEVPFEANNNHKAVVVCARHVVKRPSALVYIFTYFNCVLIVLIKAS